MADFLFFSRTKTRAPTRILLVVLALLLSACGSDPVRAPKQSAHVPARPNLPSAESVRGLPPEPVPRVEPRSRYGNPATYNVFGTTYKVLDSAEGFSQKGVASWYGPDFHGKRTSSGEAYDMHLMTAAHKTLPLPSYVRVTNLDNGLTTVVRVNDRGPFVKDRIIDLSYSAAKRLGVDRTGTARVAIEVITPGQDPGPAAAATPVVAAANTAENAGWFVQVGAFSQRNAADIQAEKVRAVVGHPVVVQNAHQGERALYRVRVGPLRNRADAESVQDFLDDKDFDEPALVAP